METEKKYLKLNDIQAYKIAFHLSNSIWNTIVKWDYVAKSTIGMQFINAADSISANLAEGWGRYGKKDKIKFYRISFGSVSECLDWNQKSKVRELLSEEEYQQIFVELQKLPKAIYSLINLPMRS